MTPADERRLQRFDAFARGVRDDLAQTERQMEELRQANRAKTATYQQLFANRMTLKEILARLEDAGV